MAECFASLIDDNWKFGSDDETLFKLIKGQIPEQTMPVVYSSLPDEQVWQILAFIRTLYKGKQAEDQLARRRTSVPKASQGTEVEAQQGLLAAVSRPY